MPKYPVILIFGPTAVGKTNLLIRNFEGRGEVINADSMQVYRKMDIGTAKAGPEELRKVPHHLIDIIDPREQFSVADFVKQTDRLIPQILERGKWPVICGGTAFYFKHFLFGLPETPTSDPSVRIRISDELASRGLTAMHADLKAVDPVSAQRINPNDAYRVTRALEVFRSTGRPLSSYKIPVRLRKHLEPVVIGLERDRKQLYARIDMRVDQMFDNGLKNEVKTLLRQGYTFHDAGMKAIGYREWDSFIRRGGPSLASVRADIQRNSRRYAKRQYTFFRKIPGVRWFNPEEPDLITAALGEFRRAGGWNLPAFD